MYDEGRYLNDERMGILGENMKPWFNPLGQALLRDLHYMMDEWGMSEYEGALLLSCFTTSMLYVGDSRFQGE